MLVLSVVIILAALLGGWLVAFRSRRRRRLYELADRLPGPPQLPFIGHLHLFLGNTEDIHNALQDFSSFAINNGGISTLWFVHELFCLLTNPLDIEYVLRTCLNKDEMMSRFIRKSLGNGIIFAPASLWRRRRKNMAPGLNIKNLDKFFEHFRDKSKSLSMQLQSQAGAGQFDLWPFISSYTLDSTYESVCGIGTTEKLKDHEKALRALAQVLHLFVERCFRPWLHPDWLYRLSPSCKDYQKSMKFANSFIDDMIERTKTKMIREEVLESKIDEDQVNEPKERTSLLRFLIKQANKLQPYTNVELREEVMSMMVGGTDTQAVTTCFTMVLVARHQDVQDRVHRELMEVFGNSERPLEKEDLPKLCYLDQVIKETLRLYPPVPITSRQIEKETTLPSGAVLPADCGVTVSIWAMHRNPEYWGADAELFRPDRFSPELYKQQHACVYMPFGTGLRNCLGYQYAMTSIKITLATILRKYRVRVAGDQVAAGANIRVKFEIMMKSVDGFKIILELKD